MDVTQELQDFAAKHTTEVLERSVPVEVDPAHLTAFDNSPVDAAEYANLEPHLLALTLTSTASLISTLWNLPRISSTSGPTVSLPTSKTLLPREKPLPVAKPLTKWERFAKAKGISHKNKEKREWDEEKQEWVNRWGRGGKSREGEDQWLHEIKNKDDADHNPAATLKTERKARIAKNEKQAAQNRSRALASTSSAATSASGQPGVPVRSKNQQSLATARAARANELERSLLVTKTSTASLGKFDKKIEGEPRVKGVKRQYEANETDARGEKEKQMSVLSRVERGEKSKMGKKKGGEGAEGDVNVRKAVRYAGREERMKKRARK